MNKYCFTCGGNYDKRFINEPCPECGRTYGRLSIDIASEKEVQQFLIKAKDLQIPETYRGVVWNKEYFMKSKANEVQCNTFIRYCTQLERVHNYFEQGLIPSKSGIIIAPASYSKMTWAYSCMQLALDKGFSVAPMLSLLEVKRLLVLAGENPNYKLFQTKDCKGISYDDYIMSDVCFVTVPKTGVRMDTFSIILEILDARTRKGLSTFVISRYSLDILAKRDYNNKPEVLEDFNNLGSSLKFPVIITHGI